MPGRRAPLAFALSGLLCIPSIAKAQDDTARAARIETARQLAAEPARGLNTLGDDSAADETEVLPPTSLPGDAEYGEQQVLLRRANWEPWRASVSTTIAYTDNVALSPANELDDSYFVSEVRFSYTPRITNTFFADVSVRQGFYLYNEFDQLDFDLFQADAGLIYIAQQLYDISFFARYGYERITDSGFGDELFTNHSVTLGAQKIFRITRGQQIYLGLSSELTLGGEPDISRRHEYALFTGYSIQPFEWLQLGVGYRGGYYDYIEFNRADWNHGFSFNTSWMLTDWATLSAGLNYTYNESNFGVFDYENWITSGTLMLELRW